MAKKAEKRFDKYGIRCYYNQAVAKRNADNERKFKKLKKVVDKWFGLWYTIKTVARRPVPWKLNNVRKAKKLLSTRKNKGSFKVGWNTDYKKEFYFEIYFETD